MEILVKILNNYFKDILKKNLVVDSVEMDSNKVKKNSLFFAINNGNKYIKNALDNGASLVIGDNFSEEFNGDFRVIKVANTIETLQNIAKRYREELSVKVIGVTGSEGKTTTKDIISSVLSQKYKVLKTEGNYNNHIGLPYMILQLDSTYDIAVLEMGMSNLGEIDKLCTIANPNYAVITNIGDSHLEYLKNRDNVFKAKTEILNYVDKEDRFVIGDDIYLKKIDAVKVGFEKKNDIVISNFKESEEGCNFSIDNNNYFLPLNGDYNALNTSLAISIGKRLGLIYEEIQKGLINLKLTSMRFQKIEKEGILYINDAYNASPVSMKAVISTFKSYPTDRKKIVVLSDMLELGKDEIQYHKDVLKFVEKQSFDKVIVTGELMKRALDQMETMDIEYISLKEDIRKKLKTYENIVVLLKASRGMRLEEII